MSEVSIVKEIYHWHRRQKDGDGIPDCIELYNQKVEIISDVYSFDGEKEKVIPKAQAQKEAKEERCYFCEYLRKLKKRVGGKEK